MTSSFEFLIEYANIEFNGTIYHNHAYNGLSLIEMLKKIPIQDMQDTSTYEGYSIIEILMHLIYCKYVIVKEFEKIEITNYPYYKGVEGYFIPKIIDENDFEEIIEYSIMIHNKAMESINRLTTNDYDKKINEWDMSFKEAAIWICNHDTYHIAQIRNMGIKSLAKKKIRMEIKELKKGNEEI